jgi:hypothetical protein
MELLHPTFKTNWHGLIRHRICRPTSRFRLKPLVQQQSQSTFPTAGSHSVCVAENDDLPLFGYDWVLAFDMALPKGVKVCTITPLMMSAVRHPSQQKPWQSERPSTMLTQQPGRAPTSAPTQRSPSTNKQLQQLLDEYADILKPGHGTIRDREAVVHFDPKARPGHFRRGLCHFHCGRQSKQN